MRHRKIRQQTGKKLSGLFSFLLRLQFLSSLSSVRDLKEEGKEGGNPYFQAAAGSFLLSPFCPRWKCGREEEEEEEEEEALAAFRR